MDVPVSGEVPDEAVAGAGQARSACPACGTLAAEGARFCEECGAALGAPPAGLPAGAGPASLPAGAGPGVAVPPPPCRECGGVVDEDGYCTSCGARAARPRDHVVEQPATWVAAVCDRGARRTRNEDAVAVAAGATPGGFAVLVVCDGVSSAEESDVASLAAARAAREVLVDGAASAGPAPGAPARMAAAADAANDAVVRATPPDHGDSPASCTLALAVLEAGVISAGSVGDSRAYWLPDDGEAQLLTEDDSLAAELIAAGAPREEAEAGPFAHTITRWLGKDSPGHTPAVTTLRVQGPGWLLACSDGLWNYCSAPEDLAAVARRVGAGSGAEPLATASALVDWANEQGGHDNISVALARVDPAGGSVPEMKEQVGE